MNALSSLFLLVALVGSWPVLAADTWVIHAARIYPAPHVAPIEDGVVLVSAGRIAYVGKRDSAKIPRSAKTSECSGGVLTAGFQNSHVHFIEPRWDDAANKPAAELEQSLQEMLTRFGFTTVFDTTSDQANTFALRSRVEKAEIRGPRIVTVGLGLFPPDGIPSYIHDLPPQVLARLHQPRTAEEARGAVRANIAAGADGTKLFLHTSPRQGVITRMSAEVARAAVEETHAHGKLVMAHPTSVEAIRLGLDVGVDVLVHTTLGEEAPWDEATLARMKSAHMSVIPTFKLWPYELKKENVPPPVVDALVAATFRELQAFIGVQGQVLFGTDVGYMHDYDPTDEYVFMAKAGMSQAQILESLTTAPAARWKVEKRHGQIARGFDADMVMLAADPFEDVRNFANVKCVLRAGAPIYSRPGQ
ncbi:MAG TPA: amidohydrolase family protein [Steroidobacteraceae bacterium]|nr:amidohydrolase family protein [Steroidobacteraceae bacterium]